MSSEIKVVFMYGRPSILGTVIQLWVSRFSKNYKEIPYHVEVIIDDESFSTDLSFPMGYRATHKSVILGNRCRVYTIDITDLEYINIRHRAKSMIGLKYDWLNILGSDILKLGVGSKSRVTCDESAGILLSGLRVFSDLKDFNRLNPHTLEEYISNKGYKWNRG